MLRARRHLSGTSRSRSKRLNGLYHVITHEVIARHRIQEDNFRLVRPSAPMATREQRRQFWISWLLLVSAGVAMFGLLLVLFPASARYAFSALVYPAPTTIDRFGAEPLRYISLTHAVLGGVMVGWGTSMFLVVKELLHKTHQGAWHLVAVPVMAWFVPDTAYSLLSGFWQNAVLNAAFLALFVIPLWAIRRDREHAA